MFQSEPSFSERGLSVTTRLRVTLPDCAPTVSQSRYSESCAPCPPRPLELSPRARLRCRACRRVFSGYLFEHAPPSPLLLLEVSKVRTESVWGKRPPRLRRAALSCPRAAPSVLLVPHFETSPLDCTLERFRKPKSTVNLVTVRRRRETFCLQ